MAAQGWVARLMWLGLGFEILAANWDGFLAFAQLEKVPPWVFHVFIALTAFAIVLESTHRIRNKAILAEGEVKASAATELDKVRRELFQTKKRVYSKEEAEKAVQASEAKRQEVLEAARKMVIDGLQAQQALAQAKVAYGEEWGRWWDWQVRAWKFVSDNLNPLKALEVLMPDATTADAIAEQTKRLDVKGALTSGVAIESLAMSVIADHFLQHFRDIMDEY